MIENLKTGYEEFCETRRVMQGEFDYERYVEEKTKHNRRGKCKRCGRCCTARGLIWSSLHSKEKGFTNEEELRAKIVAQYGEEDGGAFYDLFLKMVCPNLKVIKRGAGKKRKAVCQIYDERPAFCKSFPELPSELVDGCGFYFVKKKKED